MSLETIQKLLTKQRYVEGVVHTQQLPRRHVVETLVQRQHLAEIETLMARLPAWEIGSILEALPLEDAKLIWERIPAARENEVLWELPERVRAELGIREPEFSESEINAYELVEGRLRQVGVTHRKDLEKVKPVWIDLLDASEAERAYVGRYFDLILPDSGEATDLEVSTRFHIDEEGEIHLHSNFLLDREGDSRSVPVAFVLHRGVIFSVRGEELPVFRLLRRRALARPNYVADCFDILLALYGADVEYSADSLQDIYGTLSTVGKQVLKETMSDEEAAAVLGDIAEEEDLNGRIRGNIMDTQRALAFVMQSRLLSHDQVDDAKQILRNIDSLNSHTAFLFDKINFLMDATIGFININQNKRVNQLTVFGVVFMPINIIAGIGGMSEFSMMTQGVPWPLAYGAFIVGMGLVGWGTYVALKHVESRRMKKAARAKVLAAP